MTPTLPTSGEGRRIQAARQLYTTAFPDLRMTIEDSVSEGDKMVISWNATGTHKGDFQGTPPTNKKISVEGITISRHANARSWSPA